MKRLKQIKEEVANSMGSAGISGAGTAVNIGIAGYDKLLASQPLRRKPPVMFGGKRVFKVPSDRYQKALQGKKKFKHYTSYVGRDEIGEEIISYINQNPDAPVILEDESTGAMVFLRYGKK
jgi:hypothetical protein